MSRIPPAPENAIPRRRLPRAAARVLLTAAAVVALTVPALHAAIVMGVVEPDAGCRLCHLPATGPHAGAACYDCHAEPNAVARASRLLLDAAYALAGEQGRPAEAAVANGSCLVCHTDIPTSSEATAGAAMNHYACLRATTSCTDCHSSAGHGRVTSDRTPTMDRCSSCHDGSAAPRACETCHVDPAATGVRLRSWSGLHRVNRHETEGAGEAATCLICHDRRDCTPCHLAVPHGPAWPTLHWSVASDLGAASCDLCHTSRTCYGCHSARRTHDGAWLAAHATNVRNDDACEYCHRSSDCTDCHARAASAAATPSLPATGRP